MIKKNQQQNGIAIIEILIGTSILTLVLAFISYTLLLFLDTSDLALEQTQALYLAEEGQELMRYLRDEDWQTISDLTEGNTYYLDIATSTIGLSSAPEVIDGTFTRAVVVDELRRDSNDDFVESGGTVDSGGRVITVTVSWGSRDVVLTSILTNLYDL